MKKCLSEFIRIYRQIYKLPEFNSRQYTHDIYLFLYTNDKRICQYGFAGKLWHTNIHKTLTELAGTIQIGEVMPIAIVNNKSLIFTARARNGLVPKSNNNVKITKTLSQYIGNILHAFDYDYLQNSEIETGHKYKFRYWIHNNVIKKLLLTHRLKNLDYFNNILSDKLTGNKILDVSCGDSCLLNAKTNAKLIVFNDISLDVLINKKINQNAIITNHDATHLPFADGIFDSVLCRNTLHHMSSANHLDNLLDSMSKVSNHIVIVEIEDPQKTGGFAKFLNKYLYRKFLHDVGEHYLSEHEFKRLLTAKFANIKFSQFKNIIGNYMIADVKIPCKNKLNLQK